MTTELIVLILGIFTLILLTKFLCDWVIQKVDARPLRTRFIGVVVHFAIPGWLVLVVSNGYICNWIEELENGNPTRLLLTLWGITVILFAYHWIFECIIGSLDIKGYSFSVLINDVTAVTTPLISFMGVAGYFFAVYGKDCEWLSEDFKTENEIFLVLAASIFWDLMVLSLYRFFVLPLGIEADTRRKSAERKKKILEKRRERMTGCPCPRRRSMCHLETKDEAPEETEKDNRKS